ncbi:hypothetical protein [Demetria terragena]|uniref:hypothetical protein n=1 Tax=Demetria terragena TaxID=63959 RepID=UPI00036EF003|nr:hypothetical protein [Demetria terragena]
MTDTNARRGRDRRFARARAVAERSADQGGVVSRGQLRAVGIDRFAVRSEVDAGRWRKVGRHTVAVGAVSDIGRSWTAILETGEHAALDGAAALVAVGLQGFDPRRIDVTIPWGTRSPRPVHPNVVVHQPRVRGQLRVGRGGLPVIVPELAVIRGARWAASDRQAAFLICVAVNQGVVKPDALAQEWARAGRGARTAFLNVVVPSVTDGVSALSELDFAQECRRRGLPRPTRQSVRVLPGRRAYLDVEFDAYGFAVEVDGSHHLEPAQNMSDLLRQNEVVIGGTDVLRIPVLGFHLNRDQFMGQVERMLKMRGWRGVRTRLDVRSDHP